MLTNFFRQNQTGIRERNQSADASIPTIGIRRTYPTYSVIIAFAAFVSEVISEVVSDIININEHNTTNITGQNITNATNTTLTGDGSHGISPYLVIAFFAGTVVGVVWLGEKFLGNHIYAPLRNRLDSLEKENKIIKNEIQDLEGQIAYLRAWYSQTIAQRKILLAALGRSEDDEYYVVDSNTPSQYICYITQEVLRDPVFVAEDNRSYERSSLQLWYEHSGGRCPLNRDCTMVDPKVLPTNVELREKIKQYIEEKKENDFSRNVFKR